MMALFILHFGQKVFDVFLNPQKSIICNHLLPIRYIILEHILLSIEKML